eukprot:Nitzschia sp. Nitz4//scaffold133_size116822//30974//31759//NITZ4_003799-RA/size116822-snap-gene-0.2-mRNA-1//1//CDS//3329535372//7141//frame0
MNSWKALSTSLLRQATAAASKNHSRWYSSTSPRSTTILCVRKNGNVCMMGDGMVSMGSMIVKGDVAKIRHLPSKRSDDQYQGTLVGFAGSTADAFTLLERLEGKLDEYPGQLPRSCVELAKGWRTDKYLRRLEASLIVADERVSLEINGGGDVLEMSDGVVSVGSGSPYALAAARALMAVPELSAEEVATRAMNIASDMCCHTNKNFKTLTLEDKSDEEKEEE